MNNLTNIANAIKAHKLSPKMVNELTRCLWLVEDEVRLYVGDGRSARAIAYRQGLPVGQLGWAFAILAITLHERSERAKGFVRVERTKLERVAAGRNFYGSPLSTWALVRAGEFTYTGKTEDWLTGVLQDFAPAVEDECRAAA